MVDHNHLKAKRCPPADSRVSAATGTDHFVARAPVSRLDNGSTKPNLLRLSVPHLPLRRGWRWELKLTLSQICGINLKHSLEPKCSFALRNVQLFCFCYVLSVSIMQDSELLWVAKYCCKLQINACPDLKEPKNPSVILKHRKQSPRKRFNKLIKETQDTVYSKCLCKHQTPWDSHSVLKQSAQYLFKVSCSWSYWL